jgi:hypothetical protein
LGPLDSWVEWSVGLLDTWPPLAPALGSSPGLGLWPLVSSPLGSGPLGSGPLGSGPLGSGPLGSWSTLDLGSWTLGILELDSWDT